MKTENKIQPNETENQNDNFCRFDAVVSQPPQFGNVYNEDCLLTMQRMPDEYIDLIITDPPYNVGMNYGGGYDDKKDNFIGWMRPRFEEMRRVAKTVIMTTGQVRLADYLEIEKWKWLIAWHKPAAMGRSPIGFCNWEPMPMWGKGTSNGVDWIKAMITPDDSIDWHPCPKPLEWARRILYAFDKAETIYDPFLGSGTVAVAAIKESRRWIGSELNPEYAEKINERVTAALNRLNLFNEAG